MSLGLLIILMITYTLAAARVVRLINADTITDPVRLAIERRARDDDRSPTERARWGTLAYFIGCPWCVGMWVTGGTAWIVPVAAGLPLWWWPIIALAASHLIGVGARWAVDDDISIERV